MGSFILEEAEQLTRFMMAMLRLSLIVILTVVEGHYIYRAPFTAFHKDAQALVHRPNFAVRLGRIQQRQYSNFQQPSFISARNSAFSSGNIVEQTRAQAEGAITILKSLENNKKAASSIKKALESTDCLDNLEDAIEAIEGAVKLVEDNGPEIVYLVATVDSLKNEKDLTKLIKSSAKMLRIMEDLIPNLAAGPSTVCNASPEERNVAFKDLAKLLEDISNTIDFLPYTKREALQLSSQVMSKMALFFDTLNESLSSLEARCNKDKNAVYDTIRESLESMASLFEALGNAEKAKEIRKQGDYVKKIVATFEDLDIESSLECGSSGSYAELAKTLDDLAVIVEEVGIEKLSMELGIDLDFINV